MGIVDSVLFVPRTRVMRLDKLPYRQCAIYICQTTSDRQITFYVARFENDVLLVESLYVNGAAVKSTFSSCFFFQTTPNQSTIISRFIYH